MGDAGLSCLGVFELAAAIQPFRGTSDLVRRLLALEGIPGVPGDRPIPIPGSDELLVRSGDEPTEADVRSIPNSLIYQFLSDMGFLIPCVDNHRTFMARSRFNTASAGRTFETAYLLFGGSLTKELRVTSLKKSYEPISHFWHDAACELQQLLSYYPARLGSGIDQLIHQTGFDATRLITTDLPPHDINPF